MPAPPLHPLFRHKCRAFGFLAHLGILAGAVAGLLSLEAATRPVPNGSFEGPATAFVSVGIDAWQKTPKPDWYVENGGFFWTQLTGIFSNPPPGNVDHIANCHSNQAVWLFAVPEVGLFQDYDSIGSTVTNPSRAFNVIYQPAHAYRLTVGVIGSGGGMVEGVPMEIGLFYRDAMSNRIMVATTTVTNSSMFAPRTNLHDFSVRVPPVRTNDAWAGKNLGVQFLSTVSSNMQGGYWVLDHVRLEEFPPPLLTNLALVTNTFHFTLISEPGQPADILASTNLNLPSAWTNLATVTNATGVLPLSEFAPGIPSRYYRSRLILPP